MAFCASSAIALSSSSVKVTYCSFENSYPFTIWSRGTISLSFGQTYCCLRRDLHFPWRRLNETAEADSPAE